MCVMYKYKKTVSGNCLLIQKNNIVTEGQTFQEDSVGVVYKKGENSWILCVTIS